MPLSRTPGSSTPGVHEDRTLTRSQLDLISQKLNERETQLTEQAEALREREANLISFQRNIDDGSTNMGDSHINIISEQLTKQLNLMEALSKRMDNMGQRVSEFERITSNEGMYEPLYAQASQAHTNAPNQYQEEVSPIRLKDAIDTIPKFDGHKMSVFYFTKICERALQLIPKYHEYHLVQLIINKLQGHAYAAVEGAEFHSLFDLTRRLKLIFGPNKSVDQYRGELANIYMKSTENIFDYIARVQELRTAILDGETGSDGIIDEELKDNIETSVITSFVNGLPSDLLVRVKLEKPVHFNFENCIVTAIQMSKTMEAENLRKKPTTSNYRPNTTARADYPHQSRQPFNNLHSINNPQQFNNSRNNPFIKPLIPGQPGPNYPAIKICRYCKTPGHFMEECRKLAYKKSFEQNQARSSNSGNPQGVPEKADVSRNEAQMRRPLVLLPSTSSAIIQPQPTPLPPRESA